LQFLKRVQIEGRERKNDLRNGDEVEEAKFVRVRGSSCRSFPSRQYTTKYKCLGSQVFKQVVMEDRKGGKKQIVAGKLSNSKMWGRTKAETGSFPFLLGPELLT
jgi:hypothetical protein